MASFMRDGTTEVVPPHPIFFSISEIKSNTKTKNQQKQQHGFVGKQTRGFRTKIKSFYFIFYLHISWWYSRRAIATEDWSDFSESEATTRSRKTFKWESKRRWKLARKLRKRAKYCYLQASLVYIIPVCYSFVHFTVPQMHVKLPLCSINICKKDVRL